MLIEVFGVAQLKSPRFFRGRFEHFSLVGLDRDNDFGALGGECRAKDHGINVLILFSGRFGMATGDEKCQEVRCCISQSDPFFKEYKLRKDLFLLLNEALKPQEMDAAPTLGFNGEPFLKRSLEEPLGENERAQKWPRLNGCLSIGETIFDGEELVDGTGGSKGGKQDASPEPLSPSQESLEDREEEKESALKEEEARSEETQSVETRVEETEVQPDDSVEDLIRKGKEIIIQGFNWESHKQQWWSSLKEKVPELAAWGFTSIWLPPICDSLAPQG